MRKFRFPLQKLLEIKEHKEKLVKNEMAKAQRKKVIYLNEKQDIINKYKNGLKNMKQEEKNKRLSVDKLQNYQKYFSYLKMEESERDNLIKLADEEIAIIAKKLVEARKEKRVLERLKEKKLQQYNYELRKEEQDFLDEVGINKYARNNIFKKKKIEKEIELPVAMNEPEDITKKIYDEIMRGGKE